MTGRGELRPRWFSNERLEAMIETDTSRPRMPLIPGYECSRAAIRSNRSLPALNGVRSERRLAEFLDVGPSRTKACKFGPSSQKDP